MFLAAFEHGLRHARFSQFQGQYVADENCSIFLHQVAGELVQRIHALTFDLGVDRPRAHLVAGALGDGQLALPCPRPAARFELRSRRN